MGRARAINGRQQTGTPAGRHTAATQECCCAQLRRPRAGTPAAQSHKFSAAAATSAAVQARTCADAVQLGVEGDDGGGTLPAACLRRQVLVQRRHLQHLLGVEVRVAAGKGRRGGGEQAAGREMGRHGFVTQRAQQQRPCEAATPASQPAASPQGPCLPQQSSRPGCLPVHHRPAAIWRQPGASQRLRHDQQLLPPVQLVGGVDLAHGDAHVQEGVRLHLRPARAPRQRHASSASEPPSALCQLKPPPPEEQPQAVRQRVTACPLTR